MKGRMAEHSRLPETLGFLEEVQQFFRIGFERGTNERVLLQFFLRKFICFEILVGTFVDNNHVFGPLIEQHNGLSREVFRLLNLVQPEVQRLKRFKDDLRILILPDTSSDFNVLTQFLHESGNVISLSPRKSEEVLGEDGLSLCGKLFCLDNEVHVEAGHDQAGQLLVFFHEMNIIRARKKLG